MSEPFDIYSDSIVVTVGAWGSNLSFQLQEAHPSPPTVTQPKRLGTVRMSVEHLKAMAFILRRQVTQYERSHGMKYDVPTSLLSQMGIAPEDWDAFWSNQGD